MNDPFFDEDDGEFDDLYENPRPSSSPAERRKPRNNGAPAARPVTSAGRPSTRSPAGSSSAVSMSYARDRAGSSTTDLGASGSQDKRRNRHGKSRRKGSQELFDVQWQSDVQVASCILCKADFSLVRRKHHCRHCGRVMCSDCSSFLYFEFSHRKHRVCATCNNQLLAEQEAYDRETFDAGSQKRNTNLLDDLSEDGRLSTVSKAPVSSMSGDVQHNGDDEKERRKQEKKERKDRKKKEKLEKKRYTAQVTTTVVTPSQKRADSEDKPSSTLFDGADDDWFTDVPKQHARSRDSGDEFNDQDGSKGSHWRDRVKDTYTVIAASEQTSVLAPMTGSTLTAGITGKGYISDQFRYDDVGGPGLGHDDDHSMAMPQPKQQSVTRTYTDQSVKPSRVSGNGYFSEQFQYDVAGPGLGHDDDRSVAMPRPKQQLLTAYDGAMPCQRQSKSRARGSENMTLDELNSSYSSDDEPLMLASAMPRPTVTTAQPTFYDKEADKRVIDDSPGFFESSIAERQAQYKKEEEQQQQLASDMACINNSALPSSVPAHRFSSGQESYSIVDHPSSNSPVQSRQGGKAGEIAAGNAKGGFTGALKRFFGMGSKSAGKKAITPPKAVKVSPPRAGIVPEKESVDKHKSDKPDNKPGSPIESALDGLERHTMLDFGVTGENKESALQENFRHITAGYVDPRDASSRFEAPMASRTGVSQGYEDVQQVSERKRRGTFDDLFESPKNNVSVTNADRGWTARVDEGATTDRASYGATAVGVSRFDHRRSVDEADVFMLGNEPQSVDPLTGANKPIEEWRRSTVISLLDDRKDATQSEGPGFTWSNVQSASAFGSATYAVPTRLQPRTVYEGDRSTLLSTALLDATPGNIMDDLKRGSTSKKAQGQESVDEFFAEFEEPNDYVFDPATGGYVAARFPRRAAVSRHVTRSESAELIPARTVLDKAVRSNSERDYNASSIPTASSTARTIISKDGDEAVQDEVEEIIVDKISSLESELAALKHLIRTRKGTGGSKKPQLNHGSRVRKESIFDNDSSDEEPSNAYASRIRPVATRESKRRPPSSKKHVKKRKDSFADLFEDSPNEKEALGGVTSYEALFQTEAKVADASKEEDSDDDAELALKPTKTKATSRSRLSRPAQDDADDDPELTSLSGRRGKQSSRRKVDDVDDAPTNLTSEETLVLPSSVDIVPVVKLVKEQAEEDPIDALFDTANDRDVTKLYGGDDGHDSEDKNLTSESKSAPILKSKSPLFTQAPSTSLTDEEESEMSSSTVKSVAPVSKATGVLADSLDSQDSDVADEAEDFSINWTKMRKVKSRRHKSRRSTSGSSQTVDIVTTEDLMETNLLDMSSEAKARVPREHESPRGSVPSTNWISVSTLRDETVQISRPSDGELGCLLDGNSHVESANVLLMNEHKNEDNLDVTSASLLMDNQAPMEEVGTPISSTNNVILTGESNDLAENSPVFTVNVVGEVTDAATVKKVQEEDAAFDIFDKSRDVDLLSGSSPLDLKAFDHERGDSEDDGKESLSGDDEALSLEIKTPLKRPFVLELPTSSSRALSLSESRESSSLRSPASADENVELGEYAASTRPSSSRTPSIDGSLEDLDDVPGDDEPALGQVESQAFDTDWQQMQAKEKERKKRLQLKQRQAQRDKVLRKQSVSSRSLSATPGASKSKSKSKMKKKEKDDSASSSSHHKKSSSLRKHRHRDKGEGYPHASEPTRSLTEL